MNSSMEKLTNWLSKFLNEGKAENRDELDRVKRKLEKLKRKSRTLKELLEQTSDPKERAQLDQELEVAKAIRKKAHAKYRELKDALNARQK
ncbi:hypothetical protein ACFSJ3_05465 [Corallincola platygyrae]|uniref:Uncharacterized protein n=1 Tax=Corallincola platygyrae TaxID=1193278 RepID=A0ABW4XJY6_9GAMM